jgi:beta-glucosidase
MIMSMRWKTLIVLLAMWVSQGAQGAYAAGMPVYKDPKAPIERRVKDLLGRMTLEEKVAQLCGVWPVDPFADPNQVFDASKAKAVLGQGVCTIGPFRWPLEKEIPFRNAIQKYLMENTRLGIPVIFHDEGCHGVSAPNATSFPAPIGLACSWDPELIERVYTVVAGEMRARGSQYTLAPIVDIDRDPRWGRTDETMGEDPYLNGKLGAAMVFGFQGRDWPAIGAGHVAATLKHLTGHGQPEGGNNRSPGDVTLRQLYEAHLVPFQMVIAEAHPFAVMPSYNEVDGVPSHANTWLLQDVLRKQFGFDGLIASDYNGIKDLDAFHHVARDKAEAALTAFRAGVEVDLPVDGAVYPALKGLVELGKIPVAEVEARVRKILRFKFAMGLFENPYTDEQQAVAITKLDSSRALALEAARKSIVLLKNSNNILPLARGRYKKIAVIGPDAKEAHLGSYPGIPWQSVSLLDGVKEKVGSAADVLYAEGCKITKNDVPSFLAAWKEINQQIFPTEAENKAAIAEAVQMARQADLILLAIGENELICRESWAPDHVGDRTALELFGAQGDLARAMMALGKPVVVYLVNGRPLAIPEIDDRADAIVEGWYMGQETGHAAADILFGDVNPSGKLTISFPRATGDLPDYYNHKPSAHTYPTVDENTVKPLYPFGFGLSYTTFELSDLKLSAPTIRKKETTQVQATIANTGPRQGDTIVQLYIHDKIASVTRPVKELKGFQRISLEPGQRRQVTFTITPKDLSFYDMQMRYGVEPGEFEIMVGASSEDVKTVTLNVTD